MASDAIDSICSFIRQRYWADAATLNQVISLDCMLQVVRAALDPVLNLTGDPNDRSPVSPPTPPCPGDKWCPVPGCTVVCSYQSDRCANHQLPDLNETIRELKAWSVKHRHTFEFFGTEYAQKFHALITKLPDPPAPKVDVLRECQATFEKEAHKGRCRPPDALRAALRRYLELRGLPKDPELEEP